MVKTVEDFLFSADPNIEYKRTGQTCTHSRPPIPQRPRIIRRWRDFDLDTMLSMGDGIFAQALSQAFDVQKYPEHLVFKSQHFSAPFDETGLDVALTKSVQTTVSCALAQSQCYFRRQNQLQQISEPGISMVQGCLAAKILAESEDRDSELKPDWAGCFPAPAVSAESKYSQAPPPTQIPGDTKLRWKVDFGLLQKANRTSETLIFEDFGRDKSKTVLPPALKSGQIGHDRGGKDVLPVTKYDSTYVGLRLALIQVYSYCFFAQCRYGYIISETQLLVFRIRPSGDTEAQYDDITSALKDDGLLEYRIIGYNNDDRKRLSVNLALWWLHLLAAIDNEVRWWYTPLKEMDLTTHFDEAELRRREISPEYQAPPDSQHVEKPTGDLRPPEPRAGKKRKQVSTHKSSVRSKPAKVPAKTVMDDNIVYDDPESDPEMRPIPSSPLKNPDDPVLPQQIPAKMEAGSTVQDIGKRKEKYINRQESSQAS